MPLGVAGIEGPDVPGGLYNHCSEADDVSKEAEGLNIFSMSHGEIDPVAGCSGVEADGRGFGHRHLDGPLCVVTVINILVIVFKEAEPNCHEHS